MKKLQCEICGGSLLMDESGEFAACENCGMKFKKESIKKMLVELSGSVTVEGVASAESLLKRADQLREHCDWSKAEEYYDRVLEIDSECSLAHWGLMLATKRLASADELVCEKLYVRDCDGYQLAIKYANSVELAYITKFVEAIGPAIKSDIEMRKNDADALLMEGEFDVHWFLHGRRRWDYMGIFPELYELVENPDVYIFEAGKLDFQTACKVIEVSIRRNKCRILIFCEDFDVELREILALFSGMYTLYSALIKHKGNLDALSKLARVANVHYFEKLEDVPDDHTKLVSSFPPADPIQSVVLTNDAIVFYPLLKPLKYDVGLSLGESANIMMQPCFEHAVRGFRAQVKEIRGGNITAEDIQKRLEWDSNPLFSL